MSFPENDRRVRSKSGKAFPHRRGGDGAFFAEAVAGALKADFGSASSAVKRVARLTHANERAVRNWFEAKNGPSGENLVSLMHHSDAVLDAVLMLSNRERVAHFNVLGRLKGHLLAAVVAIDAIGEQRS